MCAGGAILVVLSQAEGKTNLSMVQRALFNTFKIRFRLGAFHGFIVWAHGTDRHNTDVKQCFYFGDDWYFKRCL